MKPWWLLGFPLISPIDSARANQVALSPTHCVKTQHSCELPLTITWNFDQPRDFCLRRKTTNEDLYCHKQTQQGKITIHVPFAQSEPLLFIDLQTKTTIKQFSLKVMVPSTLRKRKRHAWSIL
ncbi:DUF3019 domain-containing protein [Thalassotalea litorea]|uniref:DUF3019 domain-containing protein n=1 Tax=Thalassotalea litorea TaxID=2020715 RepID=A0A5R9IW08_9GAMM|nr:DUF3019 domain-containing protein [Thalassotalea litorea]TLU67561.1 DUF3019 domain-containing protein [Thalassotalea litorea]